ncbi:hypothetical protein [Streptomyces sp. NPDC091215]|uniref:hypothetical protein n=1 Tax=Streptomyces sp. NPDC091215 TaxID=3155192 RepID=UPI0034195243
MGEAVARRCGRSGHGGAQREGADTGRAGEFEQVTPIHALVAVVLAHWSCLLIMDGSEQETVREARDIGNRERS